jgi:asparagine synthase (glutamine-hydrolysing)
MVGMSTFVNLSATYALPAEAPGVVIEACGQGGMMGDGIKGSTIRRADSPAAALYEAKHLVDADAVRRVLDSPVEPMATYRREAARSDRESTYATVMDCYYRNYFPRGDFGSNPLARSQFDTRVPLAHREFLDRMTDLPVEYRTRTFPRTRVPVGTSRMKLELVRRLDRGLESIPYERTKLPPTAPEWAHGVGFVARTVADRAAGRITYGGRSMLAAWYREHEGFARLVDDLVASAAERPIFDAKELHRAREQTRTGERDRTSLLSGVVTAEQWLREHV